MDRLPEIIMISGGETLGEATFFSGAEHPLFLHGVA